MLIVLVYLNVWVCGWACASHRMIWRRKWSGIKSHLRWFDEHELIWCRCAEFFKRFSFVIWTVCFVVVWLVVVAVIAVTGAAAAAWHFSFLINIKNARFFAEYSIFKVFDNYIIFLIDDYLWVSILFRAMECWLSFRLNK